MHFPEDSDDEYEDLTPEQTWTKMHDEINVFKRKISKMNGSRHALVVQHKRPRRAWDDPERRDDIKQRVDDAMIASLDDRIVRLEEIAADIAVWRSELDERRTKTERLIAEADKEFEDAFTPIVDAWNKLFGLPDDPCDQNSLAWRMMDYRKEASDARCEDTYIWQSCNTMVQKILQESKDEQERLRKVAEEKAKLKPLEELLDCGICWERTKDTVIDCGHVYCGKCIELDTTKICAICRLPYTKAIHMYLLA